MIDITGVDLVKFAQQVYDLSVPRGLGFLHATSDPLSDKEAASLIEPSGHIALHMDYVHGRGCKMVVFREGDRLKIRDSWYDHSDMALKELLKTFGFVMPSPVQHGCSCECADCFSKRNAG